MLGERSPVSGDEVKPDAVYVTFPTAVPMPAQWGAIPAAEREEAAKAGSEEAVG